MVERAVATLLQNVQELQEQGWDCAVTGKAVEIYNEEVKDILADGKCSLLRSDDQCFLFFQHFSFG